MQADCESWREKLVESAAEASEELMDRYLEEGDLSEEDIKQGLRQRTSLANEIVVAMCVRLSRTRVCKRYWMVLLNTCQRLQM